MARAPLQMWAHAVPALAAVLFLACAAHGAAAAADIAASRTDCHTATRGEPCYDAVKWAMEHGLRLMPEKYPGLGAGSSFEEFQELFFHQEFSSCGRPCVDESADANTTTATATTATTTASPWGWQPSDEKVGGWANWCQVEVPKPGWSLKGCDTAGPLLEVKVLTYNLYWWNLYDFRHGNGGSASSLVARTGQPQPYDFMGFQECDDVQRVLSDAGLLGDFDYLQGDHALGIAYRRSAWRLIAQGIRDVAEDRASQWFGTRGGQWARLQHSTTGKVVFFVNYHGPLPVNTGGRCGHRATAYNLLKLIGTSAGAGDAILMVGDFNSNMGTDTVHELENYLYKLYTGTSFGGVDHIFSSCGDRSVLSQNDLGDGGSDHDALSVVLQV